METIQDTPPNQISIRDICQAQDVPSYLRPSNPLSIEQVRTNAELLVTLNSLKIYEMD